MTLVLFTLFGASCALLTIIGVALFDVWIGLVLPIYLRIGVASVFWGLMLKLTLSQRWRGQRQLNRRKEAVIPKDVQSGYCADSSQNLDVASTEYTKLLADHQKLGPIQTADIKHER